jgi:hypothetical protein
MRDSAGIGTAKMLDSAGIGTRGCESLCVSWTDPRGVGFGSFSKCFRYVLSVVTPRYRRWQPILVSLRCFEGRPPEDVSLCEVFRCIRGVCGRSTFVMCCLVVSGLPFWLSSGSGGLLLLDMVVVPSGRVRDALVTCGWGLGGVFELVWGGC